MKIVRGKKIQPRRVLLYGTHGIGKSSWAAQAPDVLFLNLEDGLNDIDAAKSEHLTTLDSVLEALTWLASQKHGFRWVAVDSVDWLEAMIHDEIARKAGKATIGEIPFGDGYKSVSAYWDKILTMLDWLRTECGIGIILLSHAAVSKFNDPLSSGYDRYAPALHKTAFDVIQEWADEVLFATYRVHTRTEEQGFGKERTIAGGAGERYVRCVETPAALAKNRLALPDTIEFSWAAYAQYFPQATTVKAEASNGG